MLDLVSQVVSPPKTTPQPTENSSASYEIQLFTKLLEAKMNRLPKESIPEAMHRIDNLVYELGAK